jgi:hypothetical protein
VHDTVKYQNRISVSELNSDERESHALNAVVPREIRFLVPKNANKAFFGAFLLLGNNLFLNRKSLADRRKSKRAGARKNACQKKRKDWRVMHGVYDRLKTKQTSEISDI